MLRMDSPVIDRTSEVPLYRQIHQAMARQIRSAKISAGSRLPSVRGLAQTLSVSPITVVQAYDALMADGLVHSCIGRGTFVGGPTFGLARDRETPDPEDVSQVPNGRSIEDVHPQVAVHLRAPRIS